MNVSYTRPMKVAISLIETKDVQDYQTSNSSYQHLESTKFSTPMMDKLLQAYLICWKDFNFQMLLVTKLTAPYMFLVPLMYVRKNFQIKFLY